MASVASTAARSIFRSSSASRTAFRIASQAKSPTSPFRFPSNKPITQSTFRSPVELSFCMESMLPFHTATASALMTSKLVVSQRSHAWLPQDCNDDV